MKLISFDVNYRPQIESGEYKLVCTNRFNNDEINCSDCLRIICWDYDNDKIICGVKKPTGHECIWICYKDGRLTSCEHLYIMLCDTKLSKFEYAVKDMLNRFGVFVEDDNVILKESAKLMKAVNDSIIDLPKWKNSPYRDLVQNTGNRYLIYDYKLVDLIRGLEISITDLSSKLPKNE